MFCKIRATSACYDEGLFVDVLWVQLVGPYLELCGSFSESEYGSFRTFLPRKLLCRNSSNFGLRKAKKTTYLLRRPHVLPSHC